MKRVIYHIEFAKNGDIAASGGEVCMLENIKYFISQGEKNCILTTEKGKKAFLERGLKESELLQFFTIDTLDPSNRFKLLLNYFQRLKLIKKKLNTLKLNEHDIIFCHSDFFPNSIPFYRLSKKYEKNQKFAYFHMQYPSIFKGYIGEFVDKYKIPALGDVYLKTNQILYLRLLNKINNLTVISVNKYYENYLSKYLNKNVKKYYLNIFGGVNIVNNINNNKIYDCVWMGRFHIQKGINELFDIGTKLKSYKKDIKILVIGGGSEEVERKFIENIKVNGLENNIYYKGFINGKERFELLSQAKVFMMTSYFEGRPIVMIEVMKLGLPIVAYNLPVYEVYNKGIIKVGILNNKEFSDKIIKIIEDKYLYKKLVNEAMDFSNNYSWENTGKEIYKLIK